MNSGAADSVGAGLMASLLWIGLAAAAASDINQAPPVRYPSLPAAAAAVADFVPAGWRIERQARGDLNGDGRVDRALILHDDDPALRVRMPFDDSPPVDTNPRMLVVLFARTDGGFRCVLVNHTLIPRVENDRDNDPIDGVVASDFAIADGTLQIALGGFGAEIFQPAFTFRWIAGAFRLIAYQSMAVHRMDGSTREVHVDYTTRRVELRHGTVSDDKDTVRHRRLPPGPLPTLQAIGDGFGFDPLAEDNDATH
ncbi:hypothetical protein [Salinisphaera hydrothermalis]|uniref:Uncharacterized protein n=1 Tax=Salinisphaera hydrothermalis (strain C41B8) TaxID=1304275 RepID=A0A084II63_SALHC|nr:hypothetical protein [Salinisphaera hydrothermalis]KEZ76397.1 hypothetical protein C41B8_15325 [Salinisphaera hydrothermalis C41B8]